MRAEYKSDLILPIFEKKAKSKLLFVPEEEIQTLHREFTCTENLPGQLEDLFLEIFWHIACIIKLQVTQITVAQRTLIELIHFTPLEIFWLILSSWSK